MRAMAYCETLYYTKSVNGTRVNGTRGGMKSKGILMGAAIPTGN